MTKPNCTDVQTCDSTAVDASTTEAQSVESRTATPRQAVQRTSSGYELLLELPGVDPSTISLDLTDRTLSLRAEPAETTELESTTNTFCEFGVHPFEDRWVLPEDVDADAITTRHEHGILTVMLPERAPESRTIPVVES